MLISTVSLSYMVVQHINKNIPRKLKMHVDFLHVHVLSISNKNFRSIFLQLMELINVPVKALMLVYVVFHYGGIQKTRRKPSALYA